MTDSIWFSNSLADVKVQTQAACTLSEEAVHQLSAAAVPGWEGLAAQGADQALDEVISTANRGSLELNEALWLAAEVQQTWLFSQIFRGPLG